MKLWQKGESGISISVTFSSLDTVWAAHVFVSWCAVSSLWPLQGDSYIFTVGITDWPHPSMAESLQWAPRSALLPLGGVLSLRRFFPSTALCDLLQYSTEAVFRAVIPSRSTRFLCALHSTWFEGNQHKILVSTNAFQLLCPAVRPELRPEALLSCYSSSLVSFLQIQIIYCQNRLYQYCYRKYKGDLRHESTQGGLNIAHMYLWRKKVCSKSGVSSPTTHLWGFPVWQQTMICVRIV